jgi:hypothetical protein
MARPFNEDEFLLLSRRGSVGTALRYVGDKQRPIVTRPPRQEPPRRASRARGAIGRAFLLARRGRRRVPG